MEPEPVTISALQHWRTCPRQCALIHILKVWEENRLTAEGRLMHEHVHEEAESRRAGIRRVTGITLVSRRLGLVGQSDLVELRNGEPPYPVEFKHGRPKQNTSDALQLCAQAMCLEEMMDVVIPKGALFYGASHRRLEVEFSETLRREVESVTDAVRKLLAGQTLPPVIRNSNCAKCSLAKWCLPGRSVEQYLKECLE